MVLSRELQVSVGISTTAYLASLTPLSAGAYYPPKRFSFVLFFKGVEEWGEECLKHITTGRSELKKVTLGRGPRASLRRINQFFKKSRLSTCSGDVITGDASIKGGENSK